MRNLFTQENKPQRLLLMQLLFVLLAFSLMVTSSVVFVNNMLMNYLERDAKNIIDQTRHLIEAELREPKALMLHITSDIRDIILDGGTADDIKEYFDKFTDEQSRKKGGFLFGGLQGYFYVFDNEFVPASDWDYPDDYDPTIRPWYVAAIEGDGAIIASPVYLSLRSDEYEITYACLISDDDGKPLGVIGMNVPIENITSFVTDTRITEGGYGFLASEDYTIIAHRNKDLIAMQTSDINPDFNDVYEMIERGEEEVPKYETTNYENVRSIFYCEKLDNGWFLSLMTPRDEYYRDYTILAIVLSVLGVTMMVAVCVILIRIDRAKNRANEAQQIQREQIEAMERDRETVELTMLMLDASPLCCQIWDSNLQTVECNEAAVRMYGFKDKREYTERFLQECSPEYQPDGRLSSEKAAELVRKAFAEGYIEFDWMHKMPDGEPIPAEITLVRVRHKGDELVLGYTRDLREHNRMESEKREAERLANESELAKARAEAAREAILSSIQYASKIQRNLLPEDKAFREAFSDHSVIWKPQHIVGGDIYWMKRFESGTVLCVCDCTGHGTSGALLTMLVVSFLESVITPDNCGDTGDIVWRLDQRLSDVLNTDSKPGARRMLTDINEGCDIAVIFIAKNGEVTFSSGHMPIFICIADAVMKFKGQRIFVGEGNLKSKDEVDVRHIASRPGDTFYIASDGLYAQIGGKFGMQFGYDRFKRIIFEHRHEKLSVITSKVWEAFEEYRGKQERRDDFELVSFRI